MATELRPTTEFQPYVGPRPFEREHRSIFFGRNQEASKLVSLIISHSEVLLYAQSGAGKTSLVNAKLIPTLEEKGFEVLPRARVQGLLQSIAPEEIPNIYVFHTLMSWAKNETDPKRSAQTSLADFLKERKHITDEDGIGQLRIAIFDQFEEIFTFYPERWGDRKGFFEQVRDALEEDPLLRVFFVMREDHIAELDPYTHLLPEKVRTRFRMERLRESTALTAVTEPIKGTGRHFAKGVAEKLVKNLLTVKMKTAADKAEREIQEEFIEPVQLQVACQGLWQQVLSNDVTEITEEHLKAYGDVSQALSKFYKDSVESVVAKTGIREGELRRWFERTLITPMGTRGTVYQGDDETGGIPNSVVKELEDKHLIRAELRGNTRWYELSHDRFIQPILESNQKWRAETGMAAIEQIQKQLEERAKEWERTGRGSNGLLSEAELLEAERTLKSLDDAGMDYSETLRALTQASREAKSQRELEQAKALAKEQARVARRLRRLSAALVVVVLLAVGLAVFAFMESRQAEKASRTAQAARKEAEEQRKIAEKSLAEITKQKQAITDANQSVKRIIASGYKLERNVIEVQYFAKDVDEKSRVEAELRRLGFIPDIKPAPVSNISTNSIWFGSVVGIQDVKSVALTLISAGVRIRAIRQFNSSSPRANLPLIQVGADRGVVNCPVLTVERIGNASQFPWWNPSERCSTNNQ